MPKHSETRHLPYTPDQLFDLVADVRSYPKFLPWVVAVRVRSDTPTEMIADLAVGFRAIKETFTSKVIKQRPHEIEIDYIEGPLKHLHNSWKFASDGAGGTNIDFCVDFAFRNRMFEMLAGQMFDRALRKMIGAFVEHAHALYGPAGGSASGISNSRAHSAA
jgi:coenzyme Q-binding protein COQ10